MLDGAEIGHQTINAQVLQRIALNARDANRQITRSGQTLRATLEPLRAPPKLLYHLRALSSVKSEMVCRLQAGLTPVTGSEQSTTVLAICGIAMRQEVRQTIATDRLTGDVDHHSTSHHVYHGARAQTMIVVGLTPPDAHTLLLLRHRGPFLPRTLQLILLGHLSVSRPLLLGDRRRLVSRHHPRTP